MPRVPLGSLEDVLQPKRGKAPQDLPWRLREEIASQIASAMHYLRKYAMDTALGRRAMMMATTMMVMLLMFG